MMKVILQYGVQIAAVFATIWVTGKIVAVVSALWGVVAALKAAFAVSVGLSAVWGTVLAAVLALTGALAVLRRRLLLHHEHRRLQGRVGLTCGV